MPVTLRDIAKHLNLSHATVSFVLNDRRDVAIPEVTRQRVMKAAKELGYRPNRAARALVMGRTNVIAVWIPSVRQHHYGEIFQTLHDLCQEKGYETLYCRAEFKEGSRTPFNWPVDGVIAIDSYELLRQAEFPDSLQIVSVGAHADTRTDHVSLDLRTGAEEAINHILAQGCKRVAHVTVQRPADLPCVRGDVYSHALREAGILEEKIVCPGADVEIVRETVKEYVQRYGLPEGFFCLTDQIAFGTVRGLADLGYHAPKDYLITGHDDLKLSSQSVPSLTSIHLPIKEMCTTAVEFLLNRLREPSAPIQSAKMESNIVVRESSSRSAVAVK